ncbi:hypothetical protein PRIPAC_73260 [Pristionchus pacificus]|uniref:Uncharacterized protein n=1 Tax=Pristionchus pacificus TaxID=54126 RepID=A0A2A6BZG2_PRIPA|nr:hypothetical protein PRIPAC_73260 [Pristionchus pacificus]|eukprot:PDM71278.1 hypothetical protein PRIPAC_37685 [Pristionchus pacificus]
MSSAEAPRTIVLIIEEEDDDEMEEKSSDKKSLFLILSSLIVDCALLSFVCLMLMDNEVASQASRDRDNSEKNGSCKIFFVLLALVAISMILGAVLLLMWMEIRISMMKDKEDSIRLVAPSHSYFQRFDKESYFRFARSIGRRRYYTVENGDPMKYDDKLYLSPREIRRRIVMAIDRERAR